MTSIVLLALFQLAGTVHDEPEVRYILFGVETCVAAAESKSHRYRFSESVNVRIWYEPVCHETVADILISLLLVPGTYVAVTERVKFVFAPAGVKLYP